MYNLEAALIYHWQKKTLSDEEIFQMSNPGEVIARTAIGFAIFAGMILGLNLWAAQTTNGRKSRPLTRCNRCRQKSN